LKLVFLADSVIKVHTDADRALLKHKALITAIKEVRNQVWNPKIESFATFKASFLLRLQVIKGTTDISDDLLAQEIAPCIAASADYDRIYKDAAHKGLLTPQGHIKTAMFDNALNLDPNYSKLVESYQLHSAFLVTHRANSYQS
jgi:hypothetical protein